MRWGEIGSDQIPWRVVRNKWSTERYQELSTAGNTPAEDRSPNQIRIIEESMDTLSKQDRRQKNIAQARPGTRLRGKRGLRTVRNP